MAPKAVLSKLRGNNRSASSSSKPPNDHTSLPPLQTSAQIFRLERASTPTVIEDMSPGFRLPSSSGSLVDDLPTSRMTALPRFSDDSHQYRPISAASERPGFNASATISAVAARAHNFVFSIQPPRKFTASLTPNDSPMPSPNTASVQLYSDRSHSKNASTSSLPVVEDSMPHKGASSRITKSKLNLLNPLSLLARRRSSQNQPVQTEDGNLNITSLNVPKMPDDFDPRIRGKIVHDFSIPKARRFNSYTGVSSPETSPSVDLRPSPQGNRRGSEYSPSIGPLPGRTPQSPAHSPLSKEHFCNERLSPEAQNKESSRCAHEKPPVKDSANDAPSLPLFAKSTPIEIFVDDGSNEAPADAIQIRELSAELQASPEPLPRIFGLPDDSRIQETSPTRSTLPEKEKDPISDLLMPLDSLPKHMTSTSSRFSFQLGDMDSEVQERLLEEKHKEHAAFKARGADDREELDSDEDRYLDADFDDDDAFEERIPGVNADLDDDMEGNAQEQSPQSFAATGVSLERASAAPTPSSQTTLEDGEACTTLSQNPDPTPLSLELDPKVFEQILWFGGLSPLSLVAANTRETTSTTQQLTTHFGGMPEDNDELYYDDGNFQNLECTSDNESFDEAIFDDETGIIHDIPAENARRLELAHEQKVVSSSEPGPPLQEISSGGLVESHQESSFSMSTDIDRPNIPVNDQERKAIAVSAEGQGNGLTEDNLAYQNALVSAANKAAAQGRFSRHLSTSQDSEDINSKSQMTESQPGLISDDSRISRLLDVAVAEDESEDFPFDDEMEDDPMIAEANAEVLENDDEGFYGQEFGFYARAYGKGKSEMVNGGYFGPRGIEGVQRSHSAKAHFQEPSLTPITERSEWSHRNSIASLHTVGLQPTTTQAVPSPGIAQLLELDPSSLEEDISLSALLKLRRGAWSGSQTSLNSTSGNQTASSPLAQPPLNENIRPHLTGHERGPVSKAEFSRYSYESAIILPEESDEESTRQTNSANESQRIFGKRPSRDGPQRRDLDSPLHFRHPSQSSQGAGKISSGHSRESSGAESVSYVKDPEGSGRWLLERRRTGEDGESELIEQEYLPGSRI